METTVYVHLTEERGYYLPFRLAEPATVSETNIAGGTIFIAVATWIAQFIAEVSSAIDPADGRAPYISARVICAHGDLSPRTPPPATQHTIARLSCAAPSSRSFIAARSSRSEWRRPSRPIVTLVYLHFAAAIRRVVGCGERGRGASFYVARILHQGRRHDALSTL